MKKLIYTVATMLLLVVSAFALKMSDVKADTFADATEVKVDGNFTDKYNLEKGNTKKYYKFVLTDDAEIEFKLVNYDEYLVAEFYTADQASLFELKNSNEIKNGNDPKTLTEKKVLSKGTYYICINDKNYYDMTQYYKLSIKPTYYHVNDFNAGSYAGEAMDIKLNQTITGAITPTDDADWFKLTIPKKGIYDIEVKGSAMAFVYSADLKTKYNEYATDAYELAAGNYYINVSLNPYGKYVLKTCKHVPKKGERFRIGNESYEVTNASKTKGTVCYGGSYSKKKSTITIPDTVKFQGITYKVTSVYAEAAFYYNPTKIVIGKNVKKIGQMSFPMGSKLKTIVIKSKYLKKNSFTNGGFFSNGANKTITVKCPSGKKASYKKLFTSYNKNCKFKFK